MRNDHSSSKAKMYTQGHSQLSSIHMVFLNPSPLQYSRSLKSLEFGGPGVNLLGMGIQKYGEFLHSVILNTQDRASAKIMVL